MSKKRDFVEAYIMARAAAISTGFDCAGAIESAAEAFEKMEKIDKDVAHKWAEAMKSKGGAICPLHVQGDRCSWAVKSSCGEIACQDIR